MTKKLTSSDIYDINRDGEVEHVIGMDPKTKKVDFIGNFLNDRETLHVYGSDGVEISDSEKFIGSYMTIKLEMDGYVYDELVITVRGDLNGDGRLTPADSTVALRSYAGLNQVTNEVGLAGDVNKDGRITPADSTVILRAYAGLTNINI